MRNSWLPFTLLRTASLLAPPDQRAEWLREWRSELWYVPPRCEIGFSLGAFRDALWMRRNHPGPASGSLLESPASCLALLAALAAISVLISLCLLGPLRLTTRQWHLKPRDLPAACIPTLLYTGLFLPINRLIMGRAAGGDCPAPWPGRLRRGLFMAAKIVLVQPIMLNGMFVLVLTSPVVPLAPMAVGPMWILICRWLIVDQRRRCPVCLRLLTNPVRIGTPSRIFLEWYGAESMCMGGHGLLQVPEISVSSSGGPHWLRLDGSWSGLFSRAAGARE